jgi:hypothetical protein
MRFNLTKCINVLSRKLHCVISQIVIRRVLYFPLIVFEVELSSHLGLKEWFRNVSLDQGPKYQENKDLPDDVEVDDELYEAEMDFSHHFLE